jgi:hypothetical protein
MLGAETAPLPHAVAAMRSTDNRRMVDGIARRAPTMRRGGNERLRHGEHTHAHAHCRASDAHGGAWPHAARAEG